MFLMHVYAHGVKSCTTLLVLLEGHGWKHAVLSMFFKWCFDVACKIKPQAGKCSLVSAGWWDDNVEMLIFPSVLCVFLKHAYANGLKQCTILLVVLERHKWKYCVFLVFSIVFECGMQPHTSKRCLPMLWFQSVPHQLHPGIWWSRWGFKAHVHCLM